MDDIGSVSRPEDFCRGRHLCVKVNFMPFEAYDAAVKEVLKLTEQVSEAIGGRDRTCSAPLRSFVAHLWNVIGLATYKIIKR